MADYLLQQRTECRTGHTNFEANGMNKGTLFSQRDYLTERPRSSAPAESSEGALRGERIEQLLIEIRDALREGNDRP